MTYRIGIDTGGTFTDIVAIDEQTGRTVSTKTPSTPGDPSLGLLEGIRKALAAAGGGDPAAIFHGTTVATSALLEERFSSLGLVTTRGFRHILEIARQSVPSGYGNSYFWVKPERIVPLHHVQEVTERLNYRGDVLVPFKEEEARRVARWFRDSGILSVAVCFLHSYANDRHERRMQEILLDEHPEATVSLSCVVLPEYREYERTLTTVVDAFVKPFVRDYVARAETKVRSLGNHQLPFLVMQSNGGVLSATEVAQQPITTLLSGPAAGALGASWLAGLAGFPNVLTVDAGGTSTDICVVKNGAPHVTTEGRVGRFPVKVPMIDIVTIGTGGGSIAWVDGSGGLRVGPRSAGADPGPMCYGRGGDEPTLTDARLVLGRLPSALLGGEMALDAERATWGIERLARVLNMDGTRLAAGILELADWSQVHAIRQVTVKRGLDPRDYAVVAFGGSGPLQAGHVAQLLGIGTSIIPPSPGNVSALGLLAVDLKTDYVTTLVQREDRLDPQALNTAFSRLESEAERHLETEGVARDRRRFLRTADLRYFGQAYEVRTDVTGGVLDQHSLHCTIESFHQAHERLYGYCYRGSQRVEIVNVRVTGVGLIEKPPTIQARQYVAGDEPGVTRRPVYFNGEYTDCPIWERQTLHDGLTIEGPAVVQEYGSTTVIQPNQAATVDSFGNLLLS